MRSISIKIFTGFLALSLIMIIFNSLTSANIFSFISNNFISQAQKINSTESSGNLSSGAANHTVLSLIPLMIKEMENTNATTIPIKQVINATPSNVTALQNMAKNNLLNNISKINFLNNTGSSTIGNNTVTNNTILNNISTHNNLLNNTGSNNNINNSNSTTTTTPINKTNLIPVVVNLTKNTNATEIAIAKTINATPSNVTALQNMSKNNILNNITNSNTINTILNNISTHNNLLNNTGSNNNINNSNSTTTTTPINKTNLIPVVVNLTKNTNATEIAIAKTINATPSNVTALQKLSNNNILNNISKTIGNTISISNTKNLTR